MKVIIITSIWPEQLKTDKARNEGPRLLKQYLEFCRKVQDGEFVLHHEAEEKHSGSWYLKTNLAMLAREMFPDAEFQSNALPFTDLCVKRDGTWLGAILTDDERYLSSLSAKDVHAYTLEHLTRKKWDYRYIYSRNYWLDRTKVENDLMRILGIQNG
jgi:hypothetical protein